MGKDLGPTCAAEMPRPDLSAGHTCVIGVGVGVYGDAFDRPTDTGNCLRVRSDGCPLVAIGALGPVAAGVAVLVSFGAGRQENVGVTWVDHEIRVAQVDLLRGYTNTG